MDDPFYGIPPLKNWDYVGRCYDVLEIDPMDPGGNAKAHQAFLIDPAGANDWTILPDNSGRYPKGFDYKPKSGGYSDKSTQVVSSAYDFKEYFGTAVSVSAGDPTGKLFSTTLSASFKQTQSETESNEKTMTFADEVLFTYSLQCSDNPSSRKIHPDLARALLGLPSSGDATAPEFAEFFKEFGTHYSSRADLGGRAFQSLILNKSSYNSMVEQEVNVSAQADAVFEVVKAGGKAEGDSKISQQFARAVENLNEQLKYAGGVPQPYGMWAGSVPLSPAPVTLELAPLSDLLTGAYFPAKPDLDRRREVLVNATEAYLRAHGHDPSTAIVHYGDQVQLLQATAQGELMLVADSSGAVALKPNEPGVAGSSWRVLAADGTGVNTSAIEIAKCGMPCASCRSTISTPPTIQIKFMCTTAT